LSSNARTRVQWKQAFSAKTNHTFVCCLHHVTLN